MVETDNYLVICNVCKQGPCINHKLPEPTDGVTGKEYAVNLPKRRKRIRPTAKIDLCFERKMAARRRRRHSG